MVRDLTEGSPLKRILGFCIPLLIGNLFQQLYSIVDSVIVGKFLGVDAFAAIGSTSSLNALVISFAVGLCSGLSIPIAQHYGAGDIRSLRRAQANALYIAGIAAVLITVLMVLFTRPILVALQTPENILDDAHAYIGTLFAGSAGLILYNIVIGFMRALGDSRTPLFFLVLSSLLNILLDLLFVVTFGMGVAGAALATILAQLFAALLCILIIRKNFPVLHLSRADLRPSLSIMARLSGIALPIGLQFSITAVGSIVLQTAINGLGSAAVAATAVGGKVHGVLFAPMEAVGVSMVIFASQNFGAHRMDRIRQGVREVMLCSVAFSLVAMGIVLLFGKDFAYLFLSNAQPEIYGLVQQFLTITGFFFVPLALIYVYRNTLQGIGYSKAAMGSGLMEMIGRVLVALFLLPSLGFFGACFASPVAWSFADLFLVPMYFYAMAKIEKRAVGGDFSKG